MNVLPEQKPGCVAGFVRCTGGVVQTSRQLQTSHCTPEGCVCPWDEVAHCPHDCVLEGVPFEMSADAGAQLCAPDQENNVVGVIGEARDSEDEIACEREGFFCADGQVSSCESSRVAPCIHGCAKLDDVLIDGEDLRAAALILCSRK